MSGGAPRGDSSGQERVDPRSGRERDIRVRLDELSEDQLECVRDAVFGALASRTGDLARLNQLSDPKREIKEVAALGRLSYWLEVGEVLIPDRTAREVMSRIAEEVEEMDAELFERYEEAVAGHRALHTFVAYLKGEKGPSGD
jgi:hypothetical protein